MEDSYLLAQMILASQPKSIDYEDYYEYLDEMSDREWRDNCDD